MNHKTLRDMIIETNRDVKWIRAAITELRERDFEIESRVRTLEENKGEFNSRPSGESRMSAGIGAGAGGFAAIIIKILGG